LPAHVQKLQEHLTYRNTQNRMYLTGTDEKPESTDKNSTEEIRSVDPLTNL
jgi:hypothetical protein